MTNTKGLDTNQNIIFEEMMIVVEGKQCWSARGLANLLSYSEYRHFKPVIEKAKTACINSGQNIMDHFEDTLDMIETGKTAKRGVEDVHLSRYACYLVMQNADPTKEIVALGQTYFALQTRKQELMENQQDMEKRLFIRTEVKEQNKKLFNSAQKAGVRQIGFGLFNDAGYRGLYGKSLSDIEKQKGVKRGELLDRAGSAELAANLFRITQTDEKLKQEGPVGEQRAIGIHNMVGGKVRETIRKIGGQMPEDLPPEIHIKEVERELKRLGLNQQKIINSSYSLEEVSVSVPAKLYINIPAGTSVNKLKDLRSVLENNAGNTTTVTLLIGESVNQKVIELDQKIAFSDSIQEKIREILGQN